MSDFTIDVETSDLLAALEAVGPGAAVLVKRAANVTATRIAIEARARVRRRTGQTQEGIIVEETFDGTGYAVVVGNQRMPNLPLWIEHGTKFQPARPFLDPAVRLEESSHWRRIEEAVQQAIDEKGLGL